MDRAAGFLIYEKIGELVMKKEVPPNYFDYPAGAKITHACNSFTPAYSLNTPQPAARQVSENGLDVVVHGFVSKDGSTSGLDVSSGPMRLQAHD